MLSEKDNPKVCWEIRLADLSRRDDQLAIVELMNHYANNEFGLGKSLPTDVRERLVEGLIQFPTTRIFMAFEENARAIGMATCFIGFSTFKAKQLINIHDLIVHEDFRSKGIGSQLLDAIIQFAKKNLFCGVTLEVRYDNPARQLYARKGFEKLLEPFEKETMLFGKLLLDKA